MLIPITNRIRHDYKDLILEHPKFAAASPKDIDAMLWKQCFYKQIEEFRRSIRKTMQVIEGDGRELNFIVSDKAKQHLGRLTSAFSRFLLDSSVFYQDILKQVYLRQLNKICIVMIIDIFPARNYCKQRKGCFPRCLQRNPSLSAISR